jgi:hypothetical protein
MLKELNLSHVSQNFVGNLSGGQQASIMQKKKKFIKFL